jgi:CDP-L-myo-inositol myo-inositolphosphotransferase
VNRRISRPISFALLTLGLGPNQASVVTLMAGVSAGLVAIQPGAGPFLASASLFQLASILDGVDGEMARASARESPSGARLDATIDQINYAACFSGVAVGWIREGGGIAAWSWLAALVLLVLLAIVRARRFLTLHARDGRVETLKRAVVEAARRSGRPGLSLLARGFGLLQTDVFAAIFFGFGCLGQRWLIPAYLTVVFSTAHFALSWYGRELADAARADR